MSEPSSRRWGPLFSLVRLLFSGCLGGVLAVMLAVAIALIATLFVSDSRPTGYMNPSAAVGESLATLLRAAAVFAVGACLGVMVHVLWLRRRPGRGQ